MKKLLLLLAMCSFLVACGPSATNAEVQVKKIGLSFDSLVVERWQRDMETIVAQASRAGYEVDVRIANEDIDRQIDQINAMIDAGIEVLIVLPNDAQSLVDVIERAKREGVFVIAYDRLVLSSDIDVYVSFDNEQIGQAMATTLLDAYSSDKEPMTLAIVNGDPKDNNAHLLNKGYIQALQPYVNQGQVTLVGETWSDGWRENLASDAIASLLDKGVAIKGIIAANDGLATGVIRVLAERQMAGDVLVVSQDAELSACQRIVEGTQLATIYKPVNDLADRAVGLAVDHLEGRPLDGQEVIWNNYKYVPYHKVDFQVVHQDNMDQVIIKSGFHSQEDVYLNKKDQ